MNLWNLGIAGTVKALARIFRAISFLSETEADTVLKALIVALY